MCVVDNRVGFFIFTLELSICCLCGNEDVQVVHTGRIAYEGWLEYRS